MESKLAKLSFFVPLIVSLFVLSECGGLEEMYRWKQISYDQLQQGNYGFLLLFQPCAVLKYVCFFRYLQKQTLF